MAGEEGTEAEIVIDLLLVSAIEGAHAQDVAADSATSERAETVDDEKSSASSAASQSLQS